MSSKIKLTKAQRKVIELLQRGEVIMHDDRYFQVSDGAACHRISWRVWDSLTQNYKQVWDRGGALIYQQNKWPFDYTLTQKGRDLKL